MVLVCCARGVYTSNHFSLTLLSLSSVQLLHHIRIIFFAKGHDPVSIDCAGSRHIMDDLCPHRPHSLLALVCSCGESWHSSTGGQGTISLHCKE